MFKSIKFILVFSVVVVVVVCVKELVDEFVVVDLVLILIELIYMGKYK